MNKDWRLLRGQDNYLQNESLIYHRYSPNNPYNDHDHCEFYMTKFGFGKDDLHFGYSTIDNNIWICERCYQDFKDHFMWIVKKA